MLARLVTSADPHYRCRILGLQADDSTIAPAGVFDVTFYASGRTLRELVEHVAEVAEVAADDSGTLLGALDEQGARLVIAVDAVDEATNPRELCWLLCDLAARGNRLLVACRPHLVDELTDRKPIHVDQPPYLDDRDLELYVTRLLARSPEGQQPDALADEVASAAEGNFLVAQLTAQAVAASGRFERPFPRNVPQAFERLLAALPNPEKVRDLLLPLALSFGDGLPRDLWLTGLEVLSQRYTRGDIRALLASPAASFLVTKLDAPAGHRHRLFHHGLTEALLAKEEDVRADQEQLVEAWTSVVPKDVHGRLSVGLTHQPTCASTSQSTPPQPRSSIRWSRNRAI